MLQQTQTVTVVAYYERFLEAFPTVERLAQAEESEVLHLWQGLGYYRRARNLHAAAKRIVAEHGGKLPTDPAELRKLPGLGRYTANAILCFSADRPLPILEANTIRLWTRLLAADGEPGREPLKSMLWSAAEECLPQRRCADFNQALMDLGSQVCRPREPDCSQCPVKQFCAGLAEGDPMRYPQTPKKVETVDVERAVVVLWVKNHVLVQQRPADGRWGNLWEFPTALKEPGTSWEQTAMLALEQSLGPESGFRLAGRRDQFKHGIMHYRVAVQCFDILGEREAVPLNPAARWVAPDELEELPFSSPQRRIAQSVLKSTAHRLARKPLET